MPSVLILGAGLSGLVAGYELVQAGHDVTLIEGQPRPGGRVLTLRQPFSNGLYVEAGAGRIPPNHAWTLGYAKRFGRSTEPFAPASLAPVLYTGGKPVPVTRETDLTRYFDFSPEEKRLGISGMLRKYIIAVFRKLRQMSDEGRSRFAAQLIDRVFPGQRIDPRGGTSFSWQQNEWARGAYSELRPGQVYAFSPALASREGRIHFAGEHTSTEPGWMQGALSSGYRAAKELNETLSYAD